MSPCPAGFTADNAFFHLPSSCTLPQIALLVNFLYVSMPSCLLIAFYAKVIQTTKGDEMRNIYITAIYILCCAIFQSIGLYAQDGMWEVAIIGVTVNIIVSSHLGKLVLAMALKPAAKLSSKSAQDSTTVMRFWRRFNLVFNSLTALCGVCALVVMRTEPPIAFNYVMCALMLVACAYLTTLPSAIFYFLRRLENTLKDVERNAPVAHNGGNGISKERLSDFARRLRLIRVFTIAEFSSAPLILIVVILFWAWGNNLPYAWIVSVLLQQTSLMIGLSLVVLRIRFKHESSGGPTLETSAKQSDSAQTVLEGGIASSGHQSLQSFSVVNPTSP